MKNSREDKIQSLACYISAIPLVEFFVINLQMFVSSSIPRAPENLTGLLIVVAIVLSLIIVILPFLCARLITKLAMVVCTKDEKNIDSDVNKE